MNKMKVFGLLVLVVVFSSCVRNKNGVATQNAAPVNAKVFEVAEVVQASSYSYLKVKENNTERWVAVSKQEVNPGDVFYYDEALQMTNFESKDLGRTFDEVYFVNQISKTPIEKQPMMGMGSSMPAHSGKVETEKLSTISLEKAAGETTLADVFAKREEFAAKEFEIRGIVVKINKEIMGTNWIHIQDGTNHNSDFDLTITSQEVAEVGADVTFKGTLTLNKDFGSGYSYEVIMQDAVLVSTKSATTAL